MTTTATTTLSELKKKVESRQAQIGIVGMGYVGLPLALLFSGERFAVTGFDIEERKVSTLNAGGSYIVRILPNAIQQAQKSGFRATSDYSEIARMDAIIICVPTPLNEYHEPDLSYVTGTVESIAPHLHEGQLVVLESTTYPGTTEEIVVPLIEKGNPPWIESRPQFAMKLGFTSLFRRSERTPATRPLPVTIFPRSLVAAVQLLPSLLPLTMAPSSAASSRSAALPLRR